MNSYIIKNSTIALLKKENKTVCYDVENSIVINKNIKRILASNCLFHGSTLSGRIESVKNILKIQYKVPIIISVAENIIFIQINSLRDKECLLIVANKIIDYEEVEKNHLRIKCLNNNVFDVNISKYSFERMLINIIKLNNYLKWLNTANFV